jgi:hypothetical protein
MRRLRAWCSPYTTTLTHKRVHTTAALTAPRTRRWPPRHRHRRPSPHHRRRRHYPRRSGLCRSRHPCPARIRLPRDLHRRRPSVYTKQHVAVSDTMITALGVRAQSYHVALCVRIALGLGNGATPLCRLS